MIKIKAIFYDLDNTIYPQVSDVEKRIEYCIKTFALPNAFDVKRVWLEAWLENGPLKHDLVEEIINIFSLKLNKTDLLSAYRACKTSISLEKDTRDFLSRMKMAGIKQFLITNGHPKTQLNKIHSLDIEGLFDEIVIATGEYAKPSGYWFKKMLEKYNLNPEECLSVGDWYAVDGKASLSIGIPFFYMKGGPVREDVPGGIRSLTRLNDIEEYLDYAYK